MLSDRCADRDSAPWLRPLSWTTASTPLTSPFQAEAGRTATSNPAEVKLVARAVVDEPSASDRSNTLLAGAVVKAATRAAGALGPVGCSVQAIGPRMMAVRNGRSRRARVRCGCTNELR